MKVKTLSCDSVVVHVSQVLRVRHGNRRRQQQRHRRSAASTLNHYLFDCLASMLEPGPSCPDELLCSSQYSLGEGVRALAKLQLVVSVPSLGVVQQ